MTSKQFYRISDIADFITNKLFSKLENNETEDFVRENDIRKVWSFSRNYIPNQQDVNEALYKINCHFEHPVMFSMMIPSSEYPSDFERGFYMKSNDLNQRVKVLSTIENSMKLFPTDRDKNSEDDKLCKVVMAQKDGIFLFTQLRIDTTPQMLTDLGYDSITYTENPYHFYVFNSMFKNYGVDNKIYVSLDDLLNITTKEGYTIFYPSNHFESKEIDVLKAYNFN